MTELEEEGVIEKFDWLRGLRYIGLLNALESKSETEVEAEIERLNDRGESVSYFDIGEIYEEGLASIEVDLKEAVRWYERGARKAGDGMSFFSLGRIYYSGAAGEKNLDLASQAFEKGAALGVPESAIFLAYGIISGVFSPRGNSYLEELLESPRRQGFIAADLLVAKMRRRMGKFFQAKLMIWRGLLRAIGIKLRNKHDRRLYLIDSM